MKADQPRRACPTRTLVALGFFASVLWISSALADGTAAPAKGPDVSTVGTDPYLGPLPEELTKLALVTASPTEATPQTKEPEVATITTSGGNTLTVEEQAKLAAIVVGPALLPDSFMQKLEPMVVPTEGTPELTTQELEKRAAELETPSPDTTAPKLAPRTDR
jgi:hypothetical protein